MLPLEKVAAAIRISGFPKFASAYIQAGGEDAPANWDLRSAANHIGEKLATLTLLEAEVSVGEKAASLLDDVKVAKASIDFTSEFHAVNRLTASLDKTASTNHDLAARRLHLWGAMKEAAERTDNVLLALTKIALQVWSETNRSGEKTASTKDEREAFALAFAANYLVDTKIASLYEAKQLTLDEAIKLSHLSAEAALDDLNGVVKVALDPRLIGAGVGAAVGAGAGAISDKDNRWRGAGVGALMGAPTGALAGQIGKEMMAVPEKVRRGEDAYHRLRAYAQQMGNGVPEMIEQHKNDILSHFGEGRKDLPSVLAAKLGPGGIDQFVSLKKHFSTPVI